MIYLPKVIEDDGLPCHNFYHFFKKHQRSSFELCNQQMIFSLYLIDWNFPNSSAPVEHNVMIFEVKPYKGMGPSWVQWSRLESMRLVVTCINFSRLCPYHYDDNK